MRPLLLLLALAAALAAQDAKPPARLAVVEGVPISREDYEGFLVATIGPQRLGELIDRSLVEAELKKLGLSISDEELEKAIEARLSADRDALKTDADGHRRHLERLGFSPEEHRDRVRGERRFELGLDRCAQARRQVSDKEVRQRYEERFGKDGDPPLADVAEAITRELKAAPASEAERRATLEALRKAAKIERAAE